MNKAKKRRDYLRLFVQYARKHDIWFSVCGDGCIDDVTDTVSMDHLLTPYQGLKLGTKDAYEWLIKAHREQE